MKKRISTPPSMPLGLTGGEWTGERQTLGLRQTRAENVPPALRAGSNAPRLTGQRGYATRPQAAASSTVSALAAPIAADHPAVDPLVADRGHEAASAAIDLVDETREIGTRARSDRNADPLAGWTAETEDEMAQPDADTGFDPAAIWKMVLSELAMQMPPSTFDTWMRDTVVLGYEDGEFIIGLPNAYARDWAENRLRPSIKRTLSSFLQRAVGVNFRIRPPAQTVHELGDAPLYRESNMTQAEIDKPVSAQSRRASFGWGKPETPPRASTRRENTVQEPAHSPPNLNPFHTFDTFVVGNHNRLAHAAALAIVDAPGQTFNPLFIYGGVGLGKTHLLHAIGNSMAARGLELLYCSSEQFTNDLISAIRTQTTEEFRNKYRQIDILLIDDIQFIAGKETTQEEFFHTFNHLHAGGRQVVLSSDRPPKALPLLEERLRSRFEGGLQTDIGQPDFETRVAILQSKANRMGVPVAYEVLLLVAEQVDSNIRELEGALNRLFMQARLADCQVTLGFARTILEDLSPQRAPCSPTELVRIVAEHFGLRADDLTGRKRTKEIAGARQIAMYLLREEHDLSLPAIGGHLGGRDHSTVRYGVGSVSDDLKNDESLRMTIMTLREKVYAPTA